MNNKLQLQPEDYTRLLGLRQLTLYPDCAAVLEEKYRKVCCDTKV